VQVKPASSTHVLEQPSLLKDKTINPAANSERPSGAPQSRAWTPPKWHHAHYVNFAPRRATRSGTVGMSFVVNCPALRATVLSQHKNLLGARSPWPSWWSATCAPTGSGKIASPSRALYCV